MRPLIEIAKYAVYRTPVLSRLMAPRYAPKVEPAALAAMIGFIDRTRHCGGLVAEIGVGQGDSSVFLLEHLLTTGDSRALHLFDTFNGFTDASIAVEVDQRSKTPADMLRFRYGSEARFRRNLTRRGYTNFRTVRGDAATFDWTGPVAAILLDIDLYQPTLAVLEAVWPLLVPGGGIVVDDVRADTRDDGSMQAYSEFAERHGLEVRRLGSKSAVVVKPHVWVPTTVPSRVLNSEEGVALLA